MLSAGLRGHPGLRKRLAGWGAAGVLLLAAGCASTLYVPGPEDATAEVPLAILTEGRMLYTDRCGACHTLVLPERFTALEWRQKLDLMQPRARIDSHQKDVIYRYLLAGRRRVAAGK